MGGMTQGVSSLGDWQADGRESGRGEDAQVSFHGVTKVTLTAAQGAALRGGRL